MSQSNSERVELAKAKMEKVIDHFLGLLALHENNALIVYSPLLASQIPRSFAADAFNIFQHTMHGFELVRLCALWDNAAPEKESIPTVVGLVDDPAIIDALAEETRSHWAMMPTRSLNPSEDPEQRAFERQAIRQINAEFGDKQAAKTKAELSEVIANAKSILSSDRLASVRNHRDKHLAHALASTRRERKGPVDPAKYGDETELLEASIPIVEKLYCWVNGKSFSIEDSQEIARKNAKALWNGCTFKVEH